MTSSDPTWRIPLSDLDFGDEEEAAALRVLRRKWLSMGEEVQEFEREFADFLGVRHAVAVANGTAALHLAMLALHIGPNDAVIQPAVNFVAAANITRAIGATPIFADICSVEEPTICPNSIRHILASAAQPETRNATPKALVVMHYGGYPCRMSEIQQLCRDNNLLLVEDACHAVGAAYAAAPTASQVLDPSESSRERYPMSGRIGTLGDVSCFSFFSNKNLATGEGGLVATNRDDIAREVRYLRSHGMTSLTWDRHKGHTATYDVARHGFNYRIDEIRAAIGREQLKKLENNNHRRRMRTEQYWQQLYSLEHGGWSLPFWKMDGESSSATSSAHLLTVVAPTVELRWRCAAALRDALIQTSLHYPLITEFSAFQDCERHTSLNNATVFCERVLTLPLSPSLSEADVDLVASTLLRAAGSPASMSTGQQRQPSPR